MIDFKILKLEADNSITMSSNSPMVKTVGISKLMQQVVKILLMSPGSDIWEPGIGGGVIRIASALPGESNIKTLSGEIAIAVADTERYLLQEQIGVLLNADETLQSLVLDSCEYDKDNNRWLVVLTLVTNAGTSATISLG